MRAPAFTPAVEPVHAYRERFLAPDGPNLASTIGRVLTAGGADLDPIEGLRSAIQAMSESTAGRARAVQDQAALASLVDAHAGLQGGAAVVAQPQALNALEQIKADGQATLGTPGMIAAYNRQLDPAVDDATNRITGHTLQQMGVERQAVADQTMQAAQLAAAAAWQDPTRFVQGLAAVHALALGQTSPVASDDDRASAARTAVGGAVANAVGQAIASGEPEFAAHIVGGWGGALTPAAYQQAIARLDQAAQNRRMGAIFAQAAGGNPTTDAADALPAGAEPGTVVMAAPTGAAVHPIAGGIVTALDGTPDNASVHLLHPDGSSTTYGGLGLAAVGPGDLVTPAHVIGSASPVVTLAATAPSGEAADANALLRNAGGPGMLVGASGTPRVWDAPTIGERIAGRQDISPDEQMLAASLAQRRIAADHAQLIAGDLAAGRSVVSLAASAPGSISQAADLPGNVASQMMPSTLAQVDSALRKAAQAPDVPAPDNPGALRLELMQRQAPGAFAQTNLAPLIGSIDPADLSQLAARQASLAAGQAPDPAQDSRSAVLDSLARHEFISSSRLPDEILPAIKDHAETLLRLNQTDVSDRPTIDSTVADAIQNQVDTA
jgi:hypothetical protein